MLVALLGAACSRAQKPVAIESSPASSQTVALPAPVVADSKLSIDAPLPVQPSPTSGPDQSVLTDAAIAAALIQRSQVAYAGSCPCPESYDRAGRRCGARSAYSKPGGSSPLCYPTDVSSEMVIAYRATSGGEYQPALYVPSRPSPSGGGCAENGSCYGDISASTGRAKTVPVSGYYRKDGTYVRGHYRSR